MKKCVITFFVLLLLAALGAGGYFTYQYSQKEFFCSSTGRMHKPFSTVDSVCKDQKNVPEKFERCQKSFEKTHKAFVDKKCSEIVREVVQIDGSTCKVTYALDKKSYFSYSCSPRSIEVTKKLRAKYGR